jgi:tetratricopeptide (TPR) repeat protein
MLAGQLPYQGSVTAVMRQHLDAPVPRLTERAPDLYYPPALDAVLARAMAKEPSARPGSAGELYQQFRQALDAPAPINPLPFHLKEETIREGFKLLKLTFNLISLLLTYRNRHNPSPELFTRRGLAFAKLELYGMALKSYDLALELDPEYAPAYRNRGLTLRWQGDPKKSQRDLERAAQLGDTRARQELSELRPNQD